MISEGTALKFAGAPAVLFVGAELVPKIIQGGAEAVILTAAGIAATLYLARGTRRLIRNVREFVAHVRHAIAVIFTVPERLDKIEARLEDGDKRFEVIAEAERLRIKDAIAGDERSPVDRRSAA